MASGVPEKFSLLVAVPDGYRLMVEIRLEHEGTWRRQPSIDEWGEVSQLDDEDRPMLEVYEGGTRRVPVDDALAMIRAAKLRFGEGVPPLD